MSQGVGRRERLEYRERVLTPGPGGDWQTLLADERVPADIRESLRDSDAPPDVGGYILALSRLTSLQRVRLVDALSAPRGAAELRPATKATEG